METDSALLLERCAALAVLGAIVGSFLATLAIRWPVGRSVIAGRSTCDGCGRTLSARDLVPLVSHAMLRGRCRTCGARIDPRHVLVEAGCALIGVASALASPGWAAVAGAVFGWLLLTLAVIDARDFWLPDPLTAALAIGGLVSGIWFAPALSDRLIGGVAGFATLWLIATAYRRVRGREGLGGGDPKLFGAIGVWLGWRLLPALLVIAGMIGIGIVLFRRVQGRAVAADDMLPFGTLLAIAAYPAWIVMVTLA